MLNENQVRCKTLSTIWASTFVSKMHIYMTVQFALKHVSYSKYLLQVEACYYISLFIISITWISSFFCLQRFSYIFKPTVHDISMLSHQRKVDAKSVYFLDGYT